MYILAPSFVASFDRRLGCGRSSFRYVLVFLRRVAAYADRADDFALVDDRDAALKRSSTGQRQSSNAAVANLIFKYLARPAEDCRRPRFTDADFDACHLRVVQPFKHEQMTSIVDYRDDYSRSAPVCFSFGCLGDLLRDC